MPLTVGDIIDLPVLQSGEPTTLCDQGFDREVRWVHVSDVADLSSLLQGGELVLTTGDALRAAPREYLDGMARAGVVAVVAEMTGADSRVLAQIGEVAAEVGLALVVLRRVIRFVDVTEEVHRALVAEQYAEVEFARTTHEVFTELTMRRAAPAEITASVADLLGTPVVLENLTHQAVASAGAQATLLLQNWERRSRLQASTEDSRTENWSVVPVGQGDDQWARLIALDPSADDARTAMVLERGAQALVMHRMAERGRLDLERQAQAGLIEDVLAERLRHEDDVAARASALGLRPAAEYVPVSLLVPHWPAEVDPVATQRLTTQLLDVTVRAVRSAGHTGIFSVRDAGEVRIILSLNTSRARSRQQVLETLARTFRRDIDRTTGYGGAVVGVGSPARKLIPAVRDLAGASHVADVAASMPPTERVAFRVADIRIRGLLSQLRDDPRVTRFAESELRDLLLDDIEHGGGLVEVLRGYLELAGNKSALASRLHMSRPSLYAKLARIEEILDVDLADGESMTSLHVALLVNDGAKSRV
ncbi:PucR family transcriptional regulator [Gordonia sp. CPCC 205515]|uniref:PucR family transcriptional regulator n=1 Tax=Gordonia sp. CPCC 205515 TaxID=3140791 RepID=UPI003AF3C36E